MFLCQWIKKPADEQRHLDRLTKWTGYSVEKKQNGPVIGGERD